MNRKQKKTLLGCIVSLVLVATIVMVVLAVCGLLSPTTTNKNSGKPSGNPKATGDVEALFKAVESALQEGSQYKQVFIKMTKKGDDPAGKMELMVTVLASKQAPCMLDLDAILISKIKNKKDIDEIKMKQLVGQSDGVMVLFGELFLKLIKAGIDFKQLDDGHPHEELFFRVSGK